MAIQKHKFLVERKVSDCLYQKHQIREEDISFASRYYKADQIPKLVDKQQTEFLRLKSFRAKLDAIKNGEYIEGAETAESGNAE